MPTISAAARPAVRWHRDVTYPDGIREAQLAGGTPTSQDWGQLVGGRLAGTGSPAPDRQVASSTSGGTSWTYATVGGLYAMQFNASSGNRAIGWAEQPAIPTLGPAGPYEDPEETRVQWWRIWLWESPTDPVGTDVDRCGVSWWTPTMASFEFANSLGPLGIGGAGVYRVLGGTGYRYAAYDSAGSLLDAAAIPSYHGWHTVDAIIRQAVRGDAATPWLTLRHDGEDVVREVPYDGTRLPTTDDHTPDPWVWECTGGILQASGINELVMRSRYRCGVWHPDGYQV